MSKKGLVILFLVLVAGCAQTDINEVEQMGELKLTSPAFENKGNIPSKYTCDGDNVNPPLNIEGIPEKAKSLVLIIDDPDAPAGTWEHWIVWNIPITATIEENTVPEGATQGLNDFKVHEYRGPCPPSGTHRYVFKLYALDTTLNLHVDSLKQDVENAMNNGHIIAQTQLIGLYSRK